MALYRHVVPELVISRSEKGGEQTGGFGSMSNVNTITMAFLLNENGYRIGGAEEIKGDSNVPNVNPKNTPWLTKRSPSSSGHLLPLALTI